MEQAVSVSDVELGCCSCEHVGSKSGSLACLLSGELTQSACQLPTTVLVLALALVLHLQELFYEGSGSNAELILSLILAATLVYIPITIAIVGKRLWIKYRSVHSSSGNSNHDLLLV
jgi:hypothetical protein